MQIRIVDGHQDSGQCCNNVARAMIVVWGLHLLLYFTGIHACSPTNEHLKKKTLKVFCVQMSNNK